jgi:cytidylate kinase
MVAEQRTLGQAGGVVMEGRDIGTAVFPDAEVKIFLDAAPEVRGNRRYRQIPGAQAAPQGNEAALVDLVREMRERDERDRNRAESPLKPAADAIFVDSTSLTLDEVLEQAERIVRDYLEQNSVSS